MWNETTVAQWGLDLALGFATITNEPLEICELLYGETS
jgi:hypothetical protein